jgi:phage shock protein PspC (stress-responsive transcriptional regulator)
MTSTSAYDPGSRPRPRRLERSRDDRWIAGVCGGLGEYLNIDPVIVRLIAVALIFAGGAGVIAYVAAVLLVPERGASGPILKTGWSRRSDRPFVIAGAILLAIGAITLVDALPIGLGGNVILAAVVLGGGAYLLLIYTELGRSFGLDVRRRGGARQPGEPEPGAAPAPGTEVAVAEQPGAPATAATEPLPSPAQPTAATEPLGSPVVAARRERRRQRRRATGIALGSVLLVVGAAGALLAAGVYDLRPETFVAGAIVVTGAALVASAWFGGAPLLIWLGLATAAVLGALTAANVNLSGGVGDRVYRPAAATELKSDYKLGIGRLWVDMRDTELAPGTTNMKADLGMGELTVVVPDGVPVQVKGQAGGGDLKLLGREANGADVERTVTDVPRVRAGGPPRRLVIDAQVGFGEVRILRGQSAPRPDGGYDSASVSSPAWVRPLAFGGAR